MGVGKTSVGGKLASLLGVPFRDSDRDIEARHGATVRELAERVGIDGMHALEAEALLDALDDPQRSVIAAAASVADNERSLGALEETQATVVWLRTDLDTLAERFRSSEHRPIFGADPRAFLAQQARERNGAFQRVADVTIDLEGRTPDQLAQSIGALPEVQ
jgi:shikimate kinase